MTQEKTDALVIRLADFSETSRVVTLFTRDFGRIGVLAKGAKRLRGPFEAALDLLAVCRVVFLRKSASSLDLLTEAQLTTRFKPPRQSLVALYGGYYVAELLSGLCEEYDPHPLLFDEAVHTLSRLASEADARVAIVRFELVLLKEIGHLPQFDACLVCGQPLTKEKTYNFWVSQGGLICARCRKPNYTQRPIHAGTIALLHKLISRESPEKGSDPFSGQPLSLTPEQFQELRHIVTPAISHVLERRPATLRYLNFD